MVSDCVHLKYNKNTLLYFHRSHIELQPQCSIHNHFHLSAFSIIHNVLVCKALFSVDAHICCISICFYSMLCTIHIWYWKYISRWFTPRPLPLFIHFRLCILYVNIIKTNTYCYKWLCICQTSIVILLFQSSMSIRT